jgi:inorganic pyrophosphatase
LPPTFKKYQYQGVASMLTNLWHDLKAGPRPPDVVYVVVESPKASRNKYEYSKEIGNIEVDRVLYSPLHFPGDYGFIPQTFFDDGDPMDVLVMTNNPTYPGCVIKARPIGMFRMIDRGEADYKILAVPANDPTFNEYWDVSNIPQHFPKEVQHFFMVYKELEGTRVTHEGWAGVQEAKDTILRSMQSYQAKFGAQHGRSLISSGAPWEVPYGYSRGVRVDDLLFISGTTATMPEGVLMGVGDVVAQTRQALQNLKAALEKSGATLEHVVRTRVYITDRAHAEAVMQVHGEVFGQIRPATSLVIVAGLLMAEMLVEIEADAVIR